LVGKLHSSALGDEYDEYLGFPSLFKLHGEAQLDDAINDNIIVLLLVVTN